VNRSPEFSCDGVSVMLRRCSVSCQTKEIPMSTQLILNIQRTQMLAECDALMEDRDYFDIDSQESVLAAYNADFN
jgi:hypothetical protein